MCRFPSARYERIQPVPGTVATLSDVDRPLHRVVQVSQSGHPPACEKCTNLNFHGSARDGHPAERGCGPGRRRLAANRQIARIVSSGTDSRAPKRLSKRVGRFASSLTHAIRTSLKGVDAGNPDRGGRDRHSCEMPKMATSSSEVLVTDDLPLAFPPAPCSPTAGSVAALRLVGLEQARATDTRSIRLERRTRL